MVHSMCTLSKKNMKYDAQIELGLYPPHILDDVKGIEGYKLFSVRLGKGNMVECLLCNYKHSQTKIENIREHVCSLSHMRLLELHYCDLLKYHQFWMIQDPSQQELQLIYRYFNDILMKCVKCKQLILYNDVFLHADFCTPRDPRNKATEKFVRHPKQLLGYKVRTKWLFYQEVPHLNMNDIEYPTMRRFNDVVLCLICNVKVTNNIVSHCDTEAHTQYQSNFNISTTLKKYHDIWSSLDVCKQLQQIYFQRSEFKMICIICDCSISYDAAIVKEHIGLSEHAENVNSFRELCEKDNAEELMAANETKEIDSGEISANQSAGNSVSGANAVTSQMINIQDLLSYPTKAPLSNPTDSNHSIEYEIPELETLIYLMDTKIQRMKIGDPPYSTNYIQDTSTDLETQLESIYSDLPCFVKDNKAYPIMQRRNDTLFCLLCNFKFYNTSYSQHIYSHLHNKERHIHSLIKYHDFWASLPIEMQLQQKYFNKLKKSVKCHICSKSIRYKSEEVRAAIESHPKICLSYQLKNKDENQERPTTRATTTSLLIYENIIGYHVNSVLDIKIWDGEPLPNLKHQKQPPNMDTLLFLMDTRIQKLDRDFKHQKQPPNMDTLLFLMDTRIQKLDTDETSTSCTLKETQDSTFKSNIQSETILPGGDIPCILHNSKPYSTIQQMNDRVFCLLCNKTISEAPAFHVAQKGHVKKKNGHTASLIKFHDICYTLPFDMQKVYRLYFRRFKKAVMCSICCTNLPYNSDIVQTHLANHSDELLMLKEKDETFSSSTSTEDDTLMINTDLDSFNEALYGNLPCIVANGEEYPIMQRINGAIYCVLYDKYISETPLTHTDKAVHIRKERGGHFTALKSFHEVCNALPVKMQMEHRLYFRRFKKSMMCTICCQTLPYEFAVVRKHINSQFHQVNHSDEILKEKDALPYTPASVEILFENLPSIDINALSYPIMQYQCGGDIFCLSCQTSIEGLPKDHLKLKSHISKSSVQEYQEKLIQYHKVWSSLPSHFQQQQIYFGINSNNLTCFLCKTELKYSAMLLKKHLCESVHKKAHKANKLQNEMGKKVLPNNDLTATSTPSNSCREQHIRDDLKLSNELAANNMKNIANDNKLNLASTSKMEYLSEEDLETSDRSMEDSTGTIDSDLMEDINSDSDEGNLEEFDSEGEEELQPTMEENERPYCARRYEDNRMNENTYNPRTNFIAHPNTSPIKVPTIFPSYHSSTSEALYGNGLIHYNILLDAVKYPLIQNIGPYKHCLVCAQSLSSELFHCNSESHITNAKSQEKQYLLRKYHTVFVQLPIKYQLQQKYFRKEDQLRCILCNVSVPYDFKLILGHVQMQEHIYKQVIFEATPSSIGNSTQQEKGASPKISSPTKNKIKHTSKIDDSKMLKMENGITNTCNNSHETIAKQQVMPMFQSAKKEVVKQTKSKISIDYLPATKETIFKDLEGYTITVDSENYFIFRRSVLGIRCILCNDGPVINPDDHKKTLNHVQHMENVTSLRLLKRYHDMWTNDPRLQEHQFYIVQKHCHVCHITTNDEQLKVHVSSMDHMKIILGRAPQIPGNGMNGQVQASVQLHPNTNQPKAPTTPKVQSMTFENNTKTDLLTSDDEPAKQSGSTEITLNYASWIKETVYCDLAQYVVTVDDVKYPYLRRSWKGIRCLLCEDNPVSCIDVHINSEHHMKKLMETPLAHEAVSDYHQFWLAEKSPYGQSQQIYFVRQQCVLCSQHPKDQPDVLQHMRSKLHTDAENCYTCEDLLNNMGIGDKFQYCKEAVDAFYKDLDNYWLYYGIIKLPLLRMTSEGIRCILCEDTGVTSVTSHVEASGHQQALHDPHKIEKLRKFHKMWQNMSPRAQMQQQYVILMMCIACDKKLSVDTGEAHVLSKIHKGNVTLKQNAKEKSTPTKKHDIKESAINPKSQHIAHQLPYYLSYHLEVLTYNVNKENKIHCKPCNQDFIKLCELRRHLDGDAHCKLSKLKRYKGKFYCEICMMNFCNEVGWLTHLENLKHVGRITKLGDSRKANVTEHACRTCGMVIFGDAISLLRHGRNNKAEKDSKLSLNKKLTKLLSSQKYIIDTAEKLLKLSEADKVQNEDYVEECCRDLRNTVGGYFRKCDVYPFGSRVTGLGNTSSDLDVFIDIGGVYGGAAFQSPLQQADIVRRIGAVLSSNTKQFSQINMVPGARTPIVKVLYMDRSIDCDISFRHGLSVENTKFIKFCLDLQPIAKPAMLFLKDWISNSDLPFGSITSYAFTLLFIFFLQRSDYLLSVVKIRKINNSGGRMIDGWEAINYTQPIEKMKTYVKKCNLPMPQLLLKFFEFYSNFDFNNLVICPLLGQTLNKFNFHPRNIHLPPEMANYTQKLNSVNPEHFKCRTPMCVQDPFDLSHNVTKGCPEMVMKTFQINCRLSKSQISALK